MIAAPKTYEEFSSLVEGRSEGDLRMAVRRIRVTNRAALAAEGKRGLQVHLSRLPILFNALCKLSR